MKSDVIRTEVLVVGGGTGGTAAAIQAARQGAQTLLVSEFAWLGGMLTAAGVAAPDGNELLAWQTGLWGAFLRELHHRQAGGLNHAWVSFFTYEPKVGAAIFADWVAALPNLHWVSGQTPQEVLRQGDRVVGVRFEELTVHAQITVDGTELGDLLALGDVPYRWGWENRAAFDEPSAPGSLTDPQDPLYSLVQAYPVQSPTWVVLLQDYGKGQQAPAIAPTSAYDPSQFEGAWSGYGEATFLTYGQLPQQQYMLNWPQKGNDYGEDLNRLMQGKAAQEEWAQAAIAHSQNFAHFIQTNLGDRYGLAEQAFPQLTNTVGGGAFALHPYYRESRRVIGLKTVTEQDLLPQVGGQVAALPVNAQGAVSAIAIGNYPNDHHYPGFKMPLTSKSMRWGGRWTGTPFAVPYEALIPATVDGLLVCEKNISVSHIANGATRLQPIVLGLGQAAGMAAALCIQHICQPRELSVRTLQSSLIQDAQAPAAVIPLFDSLPQHSDWCTQQQYYLQSPEHYPLNGYAHGHPHRRTNLSVSKQLPVSLATFQGILQFTQTGTAWQAHLQISEARRLNLVTLAPDMHQQISALKQNQSITVSGVLNGFAGWLQAVEIT
ncbi:MAG: FAD-dependent oxidoreductase [Cyanobacteria bacterium J06638_20]